MLVYSKADIYFINLGLSISVMWFRQASVMGQFSHYVGLGHDNWYHNGFDVQ